MEQINRELKTDLGLGEHQVSGEEERIEKSFGIAVMAYLLLIRACHQEILPGQSWSIAQLQHAENSLLSVQTIWKIPQPSLLLPTVHNLFDTLLNCSI